MDKRDERITALIGDLEKVARERVGRRQPLEDKWLRNLRQYHGVYEPMVQSALENSEGSRVFVNMTKTRTDWLSGKLGDMLFPTDDRNWMVTETPVPELARGADAAEAEMEAMPGEAEAAKAGVQEVMEDAKRMARAMEREIADHLEEAKYARECRQVIEDACKVGVGVLKGPTKNAPRKKWQPGPNGWEMQASNRPRMGFTRCDYWNFFPDMDARYLEDGRGVFQRHIVTRTGFEKLARECGFDRKALQKAMTAAGGARPTFMVDLQTLTGDTTSSKEDWFTVWEYSGPLSVAEYGHAVSAMDVKDMDLEDEQLAVVWFCNGQMLKAAPYPLDSGDPLYSVYSIHPGESSVFGNGIPDLLSDLQIAYNSGFRAMMDNSGLGVGPQLFIDREQITPADGSWQITPLKVWYYRNVIQQKAPFDQLKIESNIEEISAILDICEALMDKVTSMPEMARGEPGTMPQQTATGMSLLMSSANVVFRRLVKMFDDEVTVPTITRAFDFLMQFGPDEIKGDMRIVARGASHLMARELHAQNLLFVLMNLASNPDLKPLIKFDEPLRQLVKSLFLDVDSVVKTEEEVQAEAEAQAQQPDPMLDLQSRELDIKEQDVEARLAIAEMESAARVEVAKMNRDVAMTQTAERLNMDESQIEAKVAMKRADLDSAERKVAAEIGMRKATGVSSGGSV